MKTARRTDADELARVLYAEHGKERSRYAHQNPTVLRAAGTKIERSSPEQMRLIAGNRQPWQAVAWGYRDLIGELRYALEYRARAISRTRLYVAQIDPDDTEDEPIPLSLRDETDDDGKPTERSQKITVPPELAAAAEDELNRLPLSDGYGFLGVWSVNFDVAGEAWLHGRRDPNTKQEIWQVRAVTDVDVQGSTITVKNELGQPRALDLANPKTGNPGTEEIYRLWIPHPAHPHLADSALHALSDVLEGICLDGREMRAASRSRIAANGAWLLPTSMTNLLNVRTDTENVDDAPQDFMSMLTAAMLAPITNEGDPGSVVPLILTGSREDIEVASKSHIRFDRETSPELINKLDRGLTRMATSLDIPAEILTGLADTNHWTAWLIDSSSFRHHIEPSIRLMADSHTQGMLRPALIALGHNPEEVNKLRTWYAADSITENPNRRQDALDARDRGALGDIPFLQALGFSDTDAASREEQIIMAAIKSGLDPATAARILIEVARQDGETDLPESIVVTPPSQIAPARPPVAAPAATPDETGVGGTGTPTTAPSGITAAATEPLYRLNTDLGRRLADIDRALREGIIVDTDQAIRRALERAGSRLRAKATRDPSIAAKMRDQPIEAWAARLGRDQCFGLGADVTFLLREAWDNLADRFRKRVLNAIDHVAELIAAKLSGPSASAIVADRIVAAMAARVGPAWERYRDILQASTEAVLFREGEPEHYDEGELSEYLIQPATVRGILAEIGGLPETSGGTDQGRSLTGEPLNGLGNGATVTAELSAAGVETLGYLWVYGVTPQLRRFDPHWELEGERFTSWADDKLVPEARYAWIGPFYHPGDHRGCMCDYVPAYAIPQYSAQVAERLATPTPATAEILALAADDDRAGRKGTTAQAVRDRHAEIQRLQARFMEGG